VEGAREVRPGDPEYPRRLEVLPSPPDALWVAGRPLGPEVAVAIVGKREPLSLAEGFAASLAGAVVRAGATVVSGGAVGIDAAAHRGALAAGGRTCVVAPTGHEHVSPSIHAELYDAVVAHGGTMVWPFPPEVPAQTRNYYFRNAVLVALADAVVIVQADLPSGALNAAKWAREFGRPLWVVALPPWTEPEGFRGCLAELDRGVARVLTTPGALLRSLGLVDPSAPGQPVAGQAVESHAEPPRAFSSEERVVLEATSFVPRHLDEIAARAGLSTPALATLLLTLALENVVVEGPDGFYRRIGRP
jgi:DNA processing protein